MTIYYLGTNAIHHFKTLDYDESELRKRYRDAERSQTYIDRCVLLADCCLELRQARGEETNDIDYWFEYWYFYETEADYQTDSYFHFLTESDLRPHLCFSKEIWEGFGDPHSTETYMLHIFDPTLPRYRMKKRLSDYVTYIDNEVDEWQEQTDTEKPPTVLFVCSKTSDLIYAKRHMRGLLADIWDYEDEDRPHIRFTTAEKLKEHGLLAEKIWEEA